MMRRTCGLLYGSDLQYLDHIAPFCSLLEIPLFLTNDDIQKLATEYYPHLVTHLLSPLNVSESILKKFDTLISCLPKELIDPLFFFDEHKLRKKLLSIWLPHGNSDKDNLGALKSEKIVCVYGNQMIDSLKRNGVLEKFFRPIVIGNFRSQFYQMHKPFYDNLMGQKIYFQNEHKTLLYAPSWHRDESEKTTLSLLFALPSHYNMLVKLHPNTLNLGFHYHLRERFKDQKNILFIDDIPAIYPILEKTDVYIGDHSSIAYDYLSFNRPLFFLTKGSTLIHQTGQVVEIEDLYDTIEKPDIFQERRKEIYEYAFSSSIKMKDLPFIVENTLHDYFDNEIHLL